MLEYTSAREGAGGAEPLPFTTALVVHVLAEARYGRLAPACRSPSTHQQGATTADRPVDGTVHRLFSVCGEAGEQYGPPRLRPEAA